MTQTPEPTDHNDFPIEIDVQTAKQCLDSESDTHLIDCREQNEYDFCRIEGSTLIPMNATPERVGELEPHRNSRIIVHCHHGGRSFQVVQWLRSQGFAKAQNMTGGIDVWSQEVDPSIPRY